MYKFEDRGSVKRYYNSDKIRLVLEQKGKSYENYRKMWDDKDQINNVYNNPLELLVELTSWCNYSCKMCLKSYTKQKIKENIQVETIKDIVEQAKTMDIKSLWIGAGSECLVHPRIMEVLKLLNEVKVEEFTLLTNGSCLTDKVSQLLIDMQISYLSVSLDAATKETYKKIRYADLDKVENNIEKFLLMRGSRLFPLLRVSMVELDDNKEERIAFLEKWKDKADVIDYQACVDFSDMDNFENVKKYSTDCLDPFKRLEIGYDGSIYPCCTFYNKYHVLGNINEISLKEAWQCQKINTLRESIRSKCFPKVCKKCRELREYEN